MPELRPASGARRAVCKICLRLKPGWGVRCGDGVDFDVRRGGPPCTRCCVEIIQAGIVEIVSRLERAVPTKWSDDLKLARALLAEARINYREIAAAEREG